MGTSPFIPCHGRDPFHKVIDRREPFGENIFDPVFDLRCDFIVCRLTKIVEKVADIRSKGGLAIVIASPLDMVA